MEFLFIFIYIENGRWNPPCGLKQTAATKRNSIPHVGYNTHGAPVLCAQTVFVRVVWYLIWPTVNAECIVFALTMFWDVQSEKIVFAEP